ncbi:MAG TPA: heme-binding protein [Pyrinomonadaceae bacterium]|nr:heme-binding protein [Pyrinomonadaceae bacterium]
MWRRMIFLSCVLFAVYAGAQQSGPILISHTDSTRAISFDSVTRQREPFSTTTQIKFGTDHATRIMLFAMNLNLAPGESASAITAEAEDANHNIYPLMVENLGKVPDQPWATSIVMRLPNDLPEAGDVLVRIKYSGVASNRVRVGIGQVGGGPPDDINAIPTPGLPGPFEPPTNVAATNLTPADVQTIIQQAASTAEALGRPVTIVVTDREANVLGFFAMTGAPATSTVRSVGTLGRGLEGAVVASAEAATAKAATAAFFSTTGNAFSTRTAGFIIQEHFPPGISFRAGGPLYGVQFSSLPCSDIKKPSARLGLSADPGGLPIYKNGLPAGGIGIEGDGLYTVDRNPTDNDQPFEELIAASGTRGFEAPSGITGDKILVDGIRLPFANVTTPPAPANVANIAGAVITFPGGMAPASEFLPQTVGGIGGEVSPRFFPFVAGTAPVGANALTAADVQTIISRAAQQANITRAAIRQPLGSNARVTMAVVDAAGVVLGVFRQQDAPVFGFDVAVQKARTAAFFSTANAASQLRGAGFGSYMDRAAADGLRFDGAFAFSDRAIGFLHRPFFPDGIDGGAAGPLSTPINEWSPFNVGLQLDLVQTGFLVSLGGPAVPCTSIPNLPNGIQIFAGSVPLYKNGVLAGAIGISGDGIDQDDLISAAGANGFSPPVNIRSDQIFVRTVRLPFLKFPRSPNL